MALSAARNTEMSGQVGDIRTIPQKASTTIYKGALVVIDAGYAAPGTTATGKIAVGRAAETSANAGADGAVSVKVEEGTFAWENSGTDAVAQADAGKQVYIEDDQTISKTSTGKSVAGRLVGFDDNSRALVKMGLGVG